jgi:transposase InsO family protein
MRVNKIRALHRYRTRHYPVSKPSALVPNLVMRNFDVSSPNRVRVTDITYIRTWEGGHGGPDKCLRSTGPPLPSTIRAHNPSARGCLRFRSYIPYKVAYPTLTTLYEMSLDDAIVTAQAVCYY